eukprot:Rmarinus@m.29065
MRLVPLTTTHRHSSQGDPHTLCRGDTHLCRTRILVLENMIQIVRYNTARPTQSPQGYPCSTSILIVVTARGLQTMMLWATLLLRASPSRSEGVMNKYRMTTPDQESMGTPTALTPASWAPVAAVCPWATGSLCVKRLRTAETPRPQAPTILNQGYLKAQALPSASVSKSVSRTRLRRETTILTSQTSRGRCSSQAERKRTKIEKLRRNRCCPGQETTM